MPVPYLPTQAAINSGGPVENIWLQYFLQELGQLTSLTAIVNAVPGVNSFTVATQPSLGVADAGFLGFLTDYNHTLRWTGATWTFWGGDNNGYFADQAIVPQSPGWQLCDGTVTKYLTLGVTLTETSFTTPDLISTPAYKKAAAAYTGTINAKSGSTATGTTGTGTTDPTDVSGTTAVPSAGGFIGVTAGVVSAAGPAHVHTFDAGTHTHTFAGVSVPALGVGSIEMANLGVLPYFRR